MSNCMLQESAGHKHRRIFIGPLPEKVILQQEQLATEPDSDGVLAETFRRNALHVFLSKGGKEEDWHESEEQSLVDEMMSRWRDSEWGRFWRHRRNSEDSRHQATQWSEFQYIAAEAIPWCIAEGFARDSAEAHDQVCVFIRQTAEPAASPTTVLERTGSAAEATSAGASVDAVPRVNSDTSLTEDIILADRMLVRASYTKFGVGPTFDEVEHRTTSHLEFEAFKEFMVVWRNNRVELYDDYPTSTRTAGPKSRWFSKDKDGRNVFIFKIKSRSRAADWLWRLWRRFGGELPPVLEVRNPALDTRVRIQVPPTGVDGPNTYKIFGRQNILELVRSSLQNEPYWKYLVESRLEQGLSLELAWRNGTTLDWVWLEDDVDGREREWAVLCGLAFLQSSTISRLEVRLAEHASTLLRLSNGDKVPEPPAIEGYLDRIKPTSATKQSVYLTTHNGYLFVLSPARANPPSPPGLLPRDQELWRAEVLRGSKQMLAANSVCDVRNILAVRRAFQLAPPHVHSERTASPVDDNTIDVWAQDEGNASDDEDDGGTEPLAKSEDKPHLKVKRSFELLMKNGNVVRFEAYSRRGAVEWIQHLRALIFYWRHRHRHDAREEMTIAQATRDPITPRTHREGRERPPEAPANENDPMPNLSSSYNWCVLDGCRPIIRGGKIFMRRGLYGNFKLVQLYVVGHHLIWFRVNPKSNLNQRAKRGISLIDAYVGSGYFVATVLPDGQYKPDTNLPRRYQDGLETDDPEEDTIFAVWYYFRKDPTVAGAQEPSIPPLSAQRKVAIFRTRSKIERNTWCWAINTEIEKLVRVQKDRESKLRETEGVIRN
ncbi:hypothetical protein ONZ45_g276 [Pleurotus djamor]|nr:hypothetical protein ONZ45_g276 [Pleurotus djamor]